MKRWSSMAGAAVALAVLAAGSVGGATPASARSGPSVSGQDRLFLMQNGQTNLAEISLGQIVAKRASTAGTRQLAGVIVADHQRVERQLKQVAADVGVTLPTAPNAMQVKAAQMVTAQHGLSLDKAYVGNEISGHEVSLVQTQAEIGAGRAAAVVSFARSYLPVAQQHLTMTNKESAVLTPPSAPARGHDTGKVTTVDGVTSIPVTFQVRNINRSKVPCATDGGTYTVRGTLVRPAGSTGSAVTLYLHGLGLGKFFWDFASTGTAPDYSYARALAKAGQASVIVDRLGYGSSDKPAGSMICFGSQADIAHQMVQALGHGTYHSDATTGPTSYRRVTLAGHSVGGLIAQIEAYSFGDADGYIVMDWADSGMSALEMADGAQWTKACAAGGMHVTGSTGPTGYAPFATAKMTPATFFADADPAIVDTVLAKMVRDPCGDSTSIMAGVAADLAYLPQIKQPVLVLFGTADSLFPPPDGPRQAARFTGSAAVRSVQIPGASHAVTLVPSHTRTEQAVAAWLRTNQMSMLPSAAPDTGTASTADTHDPWALGSGATAIIAGLLLTGVTVRSRRRRIRH